MDHQDDACSNAEYLLEVLDRITDAIFLAAEDCPRWVAAGGPSRAGGWQETVAGDGDGKVCTRGAARWCGDDCGRLS